MNKTCTICGALKTLDEFPGKTKKRGTCKECHAAKARKWRHQNRDKKSAQNRAYLGKGDSKHRRQPGVYQERLEKVHESQRRYRSNMAKVYQAYRERFERDYPENGIQHYADRRRAVYRIYKEIYKQEVGPLE